MTNYKSKAKEVKRKWMESAATMSRDCQLEEFIASALREAEISGARKGIACESQEERENLIKELSK